jgi:hypothetical protein
MVPFLVLTVLNMAMVVLLLLNIKEDPSTPQTIG